MLANTIDTPNISHPGYSVDQTIRAASEPTAPNYLDRLGKGFRYILGNSSTVSTRTADMPRIEQLGWSTVEALETHLRLRNFAEDWDAPGMEAYDDL